MKTCIVHECWQPVRARGMCRKHYVAWHRTQNPRAYQTPRRDAAVCDHIDCTAEAVYRIDWPQREHPEKVCGPHAKTTRRAMIPYVTITRIEEL